MNWQEYEEKVFNYFKSKFKTATFQKNARLNGKLSGTLREIDVLIEEQVYDFVIPIVIECKNWNYKLDVADIGSFIDKLNDVGISKGVIVSKCGYSNAAYIRALKETDIQLFILDFENLDEFHGFWANPYAGDCGAIISAPSGWVIDSYLSLREMQRIGQCIMYPMGLTPKEASDKKLFMYFSILDEGRNIKDVFDKQNEIVLYKDNNTKIKSWDSDLKIGKVLFREIQYAKDNYTEYSIGLNTDRFHCYCVIASTNDDKKYNLARLKYVMNEIIFIIIDGVDKKNSHKAWHRLIPPKK